MVQKFPLLEVVQACHSLLIPTAKKENSRSQDRYQLPPQQKNYDVAHQRPLSRPILPFSFPQIY